METINDFVQGAYRSASMRGFHSEPTEFGTLLALIHTEVTEILEAKTDEDRAEECSDVLIRIFDLCGYKEIPLEKAFFEANHQISLRENLLLTSAEKLEDLGMEQACLHMHSLLTKAMETYRLIMPFEKKQRLLAEKLFDVISYIFSVCRVFQLDLYDSLVYKMEKNKNRPYKHNKIV